MHGQLGLQRCVILYYSLTTDSLTHCVHMLMLYIGLHKSVSREDVLKYKCMHAALCDKMLEEKSIEVCYKTLVPDVFIGYYATLERILY